MTTSGGSAAMLSGLLICAVSLLPACGSSSEDDMMLPWQNPSSGTGDGGSGSGGGGATGGGGGSGATSPTPTPLQELDKEYAKALYVTTTDVMRYLVAPTCAAENNECHNNEDYPDMSTEGNLWNLIDQRCNLGVGERETIEDYCEAQGDTIEIIAEFQAGDAKAFGLKLRCGDDGKDAVVIRHDGEKLNVGGTDVPVALAGASKELKLHIFLDKSVMEVFINDGRHTVTRVVYPGEKDLKTAIFAEGGSATLKAMTVWTLKRVWER